MTQHEVEPDGPLGTEDGAAHQVDLQPALSPAHALGEQLADAVEDRLERVPVEVPALGQLRIQRHRLEFRHGGIKAQAPLVNRVHELDRIGQRVVVHLDVEGQRGEAIPQRLEDRGLVHLLLRGQVPVEESLGHASAFRDLLGARAAVALLDKYLSRRGDDLLAALGCGQPAFRANK